MIAFILAAFLPASLPNLAEPDARSASVRHESLDGGGLATVSKPEVVLTDLKVASPAAGGVTLTVARSGGNLEATPRGLGLPIDWREFGQLTAMIEADEPVECELVVLLPRGRLGVARRLVPGEPQLLSLDLADMPLAAGVRPLYDANGIRLIFHWDDDRPRTLRLSRLGLESASSPRGPVVDRFGQRRNRSWDGKLIDEAELVQRARDEGRELAAQPIRPDLDRYGGWTGGPRFTKGTSFRVEQDPGGRWWFVTPEGNPFWSIGTTGVRVGFVTDTARAADRRHLFEALPDRGAEGWFEGVWPTTNGDVELPGNVHFYRWNVMRKYGSIEAWSERVLERFPRWGFNTIGAWSEEIMLTQTRVPHTRFLRARLAIPGLAYVNGFCDVWDPRWEAWVDGEFSRETAREVGNPWLIGYFVDNEAHWQNMRLLDFPAESPLRAAWKAFVQAEAGSLEAFNQSWSRSCASWDEVAALQSADVPVEGPAREMMRRFEAQYADRYAGTVRRLLKKHDPDHLYLGCRFVRVPPHEGIVQAVGRHVDVLSVNCYSRVPEPAAFADWHRLSGGRPILIGEFHTPLASERQIPPLWQAFPEKEREAMALEFVRTWARQPWSVGCHWYQHADQPPTGRHTDGENQTVGVVDVTDTPHEHLVRAFRQAGESAVRWHADADADEVLYPAMKEWAKAGVRGGLGTAADLPVVARVAPGADLQAALDAAATQGGGVIVLAAGDYPLSSTLNLRSGVVLRGPVGAGARLVLRMRGAFTRERLDENRLSTWATGLLGHRVSRAGLENLTVVYDPALPPPPTLRTHRDAFINDPEGRTDLYVVSVRFSGSEDCWMTGSQILHSGSHPLMIEASKHLTVADTVIDGAHNKGGAGNGYLNVTRSSHTLLDRLHVRDLRHLSIQNSDADHPCRYNVVVNSRLEVDINYHNGDAGDNLVQDCVIAVPTWHWWGPIAAGVPGQHRPPGPRNLIFRCEATRTFPDPARNLHEARAPDRVYRVRDHFDKGVRLVLDHGPAPVGGTLYRPVWPRSKS